MYYNIVIYGHLVVYSCQILARCYVNIVPNIGEEVKGHRCINSWYRLAYHTMGQALARLRGEGKTLPVEGDENAEKQDELDPLDFALKGLEDAICSICR